MSPTAHLRVVGPPFMDHIGSICFLGMTRKVVNGGTASLANCGVSDKLNTKGSLIYTA